MEHGQARDCTETLTPLVGVSILPLSSVARDRIVALPTADGTQEYVHCSRPLAGCQVDPPSTDTSTPPTTPPPTSEAVPLIDTALFACTVAAAWGEVIADVGAVVSVDFAAATSPAWIVAGCTPMSAKRLTVACCMD